MPAESGLCPTCGQTIQLFKAGKWKLIGSHKYSGKPCAGAGQKPK